MQIAFYAPLNPPSDATHAEQWDPARFVMDALGRAGHAVELASSFRSYDDEGDAERQLEQRDEGLALARLLAARWRSGKRSPRPDLWFTHHVYYKAPDWLGPLVSAELGVPYVIAEASHSPKQAGGRWAIGHDATAEAIRRADLVLCPTRHDSVSVEPLVFKRERVVRLHPFLDPAPFRRAAGMREEYRAAIAATYGLDRGVPWMLAAATMHGGDEADSFGMLKEALAALGDVPWRLIVAGDGPARAAIEPAIAAALPGRATFVGGLEFAELAPVYAACDLYVWPGINETYGMSMYQAQAAGLAVVSSAPRGMPDSFADGRTGVRVPPGNVEALAHVVRGFLLNPARRTAVGRAAMEFIEAERSVNAAAIRLGRVLAGVSRGGAPDS